jgi:hypothetical protein
MTRYIVNVDVEVDTPTKQRAKEYVERKLRGSYTKDIQIVTVGEIVND